MSHLRCPATAWRLAWLRVAPVDEFGAPTGTPGYVTFAGTYADENASVISTSAIRLVAEGRCPEGMIVGANTGRAYRVTLEDVADAVGAGMSMAAAHSPVSEPRAPSRPTGQATMERETAAAAAQQFERLIASAEAQERSAGALLEQRLDEVEDLRSTLRGLQTRLTGLRSTQAGLLASIGVEA